MNIQTNHQLAFTSNLLELGDALSEGRVLRRFGRHAGLAISLAEAADEVFVRFARTDAGGLALRIPKIVGAAECRLRQPGPGEIAAWTVSSEAGVLEAVLTGGETGLAEFRCLVTLTPRAPLRLAAIPRDLVPYGASGNPTRTSGEVEAAQRRLNTGLCYFTLSRPDFGKVLYMQDLSSLNGYFLATGTKPENAVGGIWPDLGYLLPVDPAAALPPGEPIVLYDTHLVVRQFAEGGESDSAWQFLDMLAAVYRRITKPSVELRHWVHRAQRTLDDLERAPKTRQWHYGQAYFHPYTNAEHPDCMVQLSLLSAIDDWGIWQGRKHPLRARIQRGLPKFFDSKLGTIRRYLPDVGADKNADEVDSWYLYHPLLNLSNLALAGDVKAREMFLQSLEYGIAAAHQFAYRWPIKFDVTDFSIITPVTETDQRGQTDVGGIYAWVMLQAFQLTSDSRYVEEARQALDGARGMRFDLNYQANLTAWGAAACIRLWRITEEKTYLALSYVYLASFFHNAQIWESEIGHAAHYSNFMGVTCLQDAPYMAIYECFDSFSAFERYLDLAGPDVISSARLLVTEYCRYALSRAWYYYPDALPPEVLAEKCRNGEIDRNLSYPVEDLYPDGQPAGQVGQEIYGAGAAMVFATRSFHQIGDAPFMLFCDQFLRGLTRIDACTVSARIDGEDGATVRLAVLRRGRRRLPKIIVRAASGSLIEPATATADMLLFDVPSRISLSLSW